MIELEWRRRFFAEEIQACANLRTTALVGALSAVPREQFLRPGPWTIHGDGDTGGRPRLTPDANPRHVYHNVSVAIDPSRQLFNGGPGAVALWIDALDLRPGQRVLHIGCGLGYYTAVMAHVVGSAGRVLALEVDETLAREAAQNLESLHWVDVRHGNGTEPLDGMFDAVVVHAGVTHPLDAWLDALSPGCRMVLPLTATMPQMGPLGKGMTLLLTKSDEAAFAVQALNFVAIYSAIGLRDDSLNAAIGAALMRGPFVPAKRLRRDPHDRSASCWLHADRLCLAI